jgi:hypothetical protein
MAVADAGALDDPLVGRFESVRGDQGGVADRFAGQVAAGAADSGMDHRGLRQSQRVGAGSHGGHARGDGFRQALARLLGGLFQRVRNAS